MDANGRTFYVNHQTRTTQWRHPSLGTGTESAMLGDLAQRYMVFFFVSSHLFNLVIVV